jgi:hypothetical protein
MENVIYENESILVATEDDNNDNFVENSDENSIVENENPNESSSILRVVDYFSSLPTWQIILYCAILIYAFILPFLFIRDAKKIKEKKAFKKKYEEKNAYDHYSTSDNSGYSYSSGNNYSNNSYGNTNNGYGNYSNSYNNNQSNGYNNYNNQSNNYNSGASSSQPVNPFSNKFEGKTPDEARKIYLKYMKAFHSDTGDGSDDEDVKQINAAYDEYKKAHGIK